MILPYQGLLLWNVARCSTHHLMSMPRALEGIECHMGRGKSSVKVGNEYRKPWKESNVMWERWRSIGRVGNVREIVHDEIDSYISPVFASCLTRFCREFIKRRSRIKQAGVQVYTNIHNIKVEGRVGNVMKKNFQKGPPNGKSPS